MTVYQWLCIIGVPAICVGLLGYACRQIKKGRDDDKAVKLGIQALLRSQMISEWNKWSELGYAPIYARENFENCWMQYHSLGANGVMDNIHVMFFELPTEPPSVDDK